MIEDFITHFPTCPRCLVPWEIDTEYLYSKRCPKCHMLMSVLCLRQTVGQWFIYWEGDGTCYIYKIETTKHGHLLPNLTSVVTISSWLPFEITEQRLRILLTFS